MPDAAFRTLSELMGHSLLSVEAARQEIVREALRVVRDKFGTTTHPLDLVFELRAILERSQPTFAAHLAASELAAWIAGYHWTAKKLPGTEELELYFGGRVPPGDPPSLILPDYWDSGGVRFPQLEKAADSLRQRGLLTRPEFDRAAEAIRARSFTVAYQDSTDTIGHIRDVLAENIDAGASLGGFRKAIREAFESSPMGPAHLETVYRTNIQSAFRDGRETLASNPIVEEVFPYQEHVPILDSRVEEPDRALASLGIDGTGIYRREDPFWDRWTAPLHYNCRCGTNLLTKAAAARKGVKEAQEWLDTGIKPPLVSRLPFIPFEPIPGWGHRGRVYS